MLVVVLIAVIAWTCYALREWSKEAPELPSAHRSRIPSVDLPDLANEPAPDDEENADDEDTDPDASQSSATWYDEKACHGCEKACKAYRFHPYAGCNIGAEQRAAGYSQSHAPADAPYHAGFAPGEHRAQVGVDRSTSVKELWADLCQRCGSWVRAERSVGRDPFAGRGTPATVAVELPF